jgi:hypothetical protein
MLSRLTLLLCACSSSGSWTKGQKGVASFAYRASPGCEDGCDLERSYVAGDGAHQLVAVSGATFASVTSSAPTVATFAVASGGVMATTGMAGDADLSLLDAGGALVDRVTVHVAAVATLDFTRGWMGNGPIVLEGVAVTLAPVTKHDSLVRVLLGTDGVHFTVSGSLTSLGAPPPSDPNAPGNVIESLVVQGTRGTGDVVGANGGQSFDLPFTVVQVADLTDLKAYASLPYLGQGGATVDIPVSWTAATAAGLVYGTNCAWTVSDPSVLIDPVQSPTQLDLDPAGRVTFRLSKPGDFTATCTLGRIVITVPLHRDN